VSAKAFSTKFRLVAACCRPRTRPDLLEAIAAAAQTGFDPAELVATARAHQVEGFVEDGLRRAGIALPTPFADLLAERSAASRQQMLRNTGEEIRMSRLFREVRIEPVFVKGATLATLAHGSLALKTLWDIDMLVAPAEVAAARRALVEAGYRIEVPGIEDPRLIDRFVERCKETTWINARRGTVIELHAALVDAPVLLPDVQPNAPVQSVEVARNATITTLALSELYAYLCVHGTSHRWERLKWLTDVAALVESTSDSIETLHAAACRLGAARSSATALLLCAEIFGLPKSDRLYRDAAIDALVVTSREALQTADSVAPNSLGGISREAALLRAQRLQVSGLRARLSLLLVQLSRAYTPDRLALPRWVLPIHTLVWLPLRLITRPGRKRQAAGGNTASKP
jgi:hypothetical protein